MESTARLFRGEYKNLVESDGRLRLFFGRVPDVKLAQQDIVTIVKGIKTHALPVGKSILDKRDSQAVIGLLPQKMEDLHAQYEPYGFNSGWEEEFTNGYQQGIGLALNIFRKNPELLFTFHNILHDLKNAHAYREHIPFQAGVRLDVSYSQGYTRSKVLLRESDTQLHRTKPTETKAWVNYFAFLSGFREVIETTTRNFQNQQPPKNELLTHIGIDPRRNPNAKQIRMLESFAALSERVGFLRGLISYSGSKNEGEAANWVIDTINGLDNRVLRHRQSGATQQQPHQTSEALSNIQWQLSQKHLRLHHAKISLVAPELFTNFFKVSNNPKDNPIVIMYEDAANIFYDTSLNSDFFGGDRTAEEEDTRWRNKFLAARGPDFWKNYSYWWLMNQAPSHLTEFFQTAKDHYLRQVEMDQQIPAENRLPEYPGSRVEAILRMTETHFQLKEAWQEMLVFNKTDKRLLIAKSILSEKELSTYLRDGAKEIMDLNRLRQEIRETKARVKDYILNILKWGDLYTKDGHPDLDKFAKNLPFWLSDYDRKLHASHNMMWEKIARFVEHYDLVPKEEQRMLRVATNMLMLY